MWLLLFVVIGLPLMGIIYILYVFMRELVKEHFRDIEMRRLGMHGYLLFWLDALFLFFIFCVVTIWLCHALNK